VRYDPTATTFDSVVEKAAAGNPDFVMLCGYPETGSIILKTAYEKGYMENIDWLLSEALMDDTLAEMVGKDETDKYIIAGLKGTAPDPRVVGPAYEAFEQNYTAEYEREPTEGYCPFCPNSYDAAAVVALAIENVEKADDASSGTAIRDSLKEVARPPGKKVSDIGEALRLIRNGWDINYQGASGSLDFDANGDVMGSYCEWWFADDGSIVLGEPININIFDIESPANPYPSIFGSWDGYMGGDYHYITFGDPFTLTANVTYNYTIITGSYPQIHHNSTLTVPDGEITCSEFIDANGKRYSNWIPAIRLE